jgi:ferredoxin-nitrite reductase
MVLSSIEEAKASTSFAEIWERVIHYSKAGWEAITENDIHLLKWYGVFLRKPTPGYFMIRVRVPGGVLEKNDFSVTQLRMLADITRDYGRDIMDITTRQQVQLRWIQIEHVPKVLELLNSVGLTSLQTGHDNIRNVTTCSALDFNLDEHFESQKLVKEIGDAFLGNWNYANLPRKFNITVVGCKDNCTHAEINDIALIPAKKNGILGYNVWVGGALGSWGSQRALPFNIFVEADQAVEICLRILDVFSEKGNREKRAKARLKFLIDEMGIENFREEVIARLSFPVESPGVELIHSHSERDHIGIHPQKIVGMNYAGLNVVTGRIKLDQMYGLANLAETYGSGEVRLTTSQNVIVPNIQTGKLSDFLKEPIVQELRSDPLPFSRGLVACTGNTFCPFALIETKDRSSEIVKYLDERIGEEIMRRVGVMEIHASGCPNACGNPHTGQIGLIGKKIKVNGVLVEGADIYLGAEHGMLGSFNERWKTAVPFEEIGPMLEQLLIKFMVEKYPHESFREWCLRSQLIAGHLKEFAPMINEA